MHPCSWHGIYFALPRSLLWKTSLGVFFSFMFMLYLIFTMYIWYIQLHYFFLVLFSSCWFNPDTICFLLPLCYFWVMLESHPHAFLPVSDTHNQVFISPLLCFTDTNCPSYEAFPFLLLVPSTSETFRTLSLLHLLPPPQLLRSIAAIMLLILGYY